MGLITIPVTYLPYAMIGADSITQNFIDSYDRAGMDAITGGTGAAAVSVTGAVVGHLWWWLMYGEDGRGLPGVREFGRAPLWVRALVGDGATPNVAGTGVHAFPPRQQRQPPARRAGYNWGEGGQRLGSD
jgi:Derlin-2/3